MKKNYQNIIHRIPIIASIGIAALVYPINIQAESNHQQLASAAVQSTPDPYTPHKIKDKRNDLELLVLKNMDPKDKEERLKLIKSSKKENYQFNIYSRSEGDTESILYIDKKSRAHYSISFTRNKEKIDFTYIPNYNQESKVLGTISQPNLNQDEIEFTINNLISATKDKIIKEEIVYNEFNPVKFTQEMKIWKNVLGDKSLTTSAESFNITYGGVEYFLADEGQIPFKLEGDKITYLIQKDNNQ